MQKGEGRGTMAGRALGASRYPKPSTRHTAALNPVAMHPVSCYLLPFTQMPQPAAFRHIALPILTPLPCSRSPLPGWPLYTAMRPAAILPITLHSATLQPSAR